MNRILLAPLAVLILTACERPTEPATNSDSPVLNRRVAANAYELVDLGTLGGDDSYAYAINNRGQVVGTSEVIPGQNYPRHAFLWEHGEMSDLGTLGGDAAWAVAINNRGQVIGGSRYTSGYGVHSFFWERGVWTDLGDVDVEDINDRGQVVGCEGGHAFLLDLAEMTDLGTLGGSSSCARGINSQGQVVGHSTTASSNQMHAFLWDQGELTNLGTLGGEYSVADGINDRGEVVGGSVTGGAGGERQAQGFLRKQGVMTVLGTPGVLGGGEVYVLDINNGGQAVGYAGAVFAGNPDFVTRAHLWGGRRDHRSREPRWGRRCGLWHQ